MTLKQLAQWSAISLGILILMSVSVQSVVGIASVAFWYWLLIFLPGIVWILPLKQEFVKTFLLANIVGFSFAAVLVPLDIWAGVPMNTITFALVAVAAIIAGVVRWQSPPEC